MALSVKEKWVQKDWLLLHSSQPERKLFAMFVKETPQAMAELAQHTWDELQAKEV